MRQPVIIKSQLIPVYIANTQRHIDTSQLCIKARMRLRQRSHASVAPRTLIAGVTAHPALQPNVFLERSLGESSERMVRFGITRRWLRLAFDCDSTSNRVEWESHRSRVVTVTTALE